MLTQKRCTKCHRTLPIDRFSTNSVKEYPNQRKTHCRQCYAEDSRRWSAAHREYKRVYGNAWRKAHLDKARDKQRRYRYSHPIQNMARMAVATAVRRKRLIPQSCEVCGIRPTEAHHDDHSKPFDVRWFCHKHHVAHDKQLKAMRDGLLVSEGIRAAV
jgi:hypothetical protein